ncbi:MAG: metallophosphoesterase [Anaerolineales bacterium]|nr:metallophosphoesterase [Anaerolineales bacterium]
MKILALSDKIVPFIHSERLGETYGDVDLAVGCGDLPARYLEYVLTVLNVPLVYVPGNHDKDDFEVQGGRSADGRMVRANGVRILGFGGSPRYKPRGRHQYTEFEMRRRLMSFLPGILWQRMLGRRAFDILLTHAPPRGIHDAQDPAHVGFRTFLDLIRWARPRLMLHGHMHVIRNIERTETKYKDTRVVNVYPHRTVSMEVDQDG